MVWMFNHTHGSLIMPFLTHWAFNFAGSASGIYDFQRCCGWLPGCGGSSRQ